MELTLPETAQDIRLNEKLVLGALVVIILIFGIYPQPLLDLTENFVHGLMNKVNIADLIVK